MKLVSIATSVAMLVALSAAPIIAAENATDSSQPSSSVASLLNKANQINNQEEDDASMLRSKAGDNEALVVMADTMKQDHKANQDAVKTLADQKNIKLNSYERDKASEDKFSNLSGADFNRAFLTHEISAHRKALRDFQQARTATDDHDVIVYVDETIPVLESHLKMAENMQKDSMRMGSAENPSNNRHVSDHDSD
jgi:putative membrane protein